MSDNQQNEKKPLGIIQDSDGNKSSKRLMGIILISAGGLLLIALGIIAIFILPKDPNTSITAGQTLVMTGAALLGIGVVEGFAKKGG